MTLPTTLPNINRVNAASNAVNAIILTGYAIKSGSDGYIAKMTTSDITADYVLVVLQQLSLYIEQLTLLIATPELDIVAKAEIVGYSGSLTADAQAVVNAMQACTNWVLTSVPKDPNGFVLVYKWNADGSVTVSTFTPAQTVGFVDMLRALGATIG